MPVYTVKPATCRYIHGRDSRYAQNVLLRGCGRSFLFPTVKTPGHDWEPPRSAPVVERVRDVALLLGGNLSSVG